MERRKEVCAALDILSGPYPRKRPLDFPIRLVLRLARRTAAILPCLGFTGDNAHPSSRNTANTSESINFTSKE